MVRQASEYEKIIQKGDLNLSKEKVSQAMMCAESACECAPASRRAWMLKIACKFFENGVSQTPPVQKNSIFQVLTHELKCLIESDSCRLGTVVSDMYKYGKIFLSCALSKEAKILFEACLSLDQTHERARRKIALLRKMDELDQAGINAYTAGKYKESLKWFEAALKLDASNKVRTSLISGAFHLMLLQGLQWKNMAQESFSE